MFIDSLTVNNMLMRLKVLLENGPALFLILLLTLTFSCKKDDSDDDPSYVGVWTALGTITAVDTAFEAKEVLTLGTNDFELRRQLKNPLNSSWLDLMGMKGTFTVTDSVLNITVTEVGQSTLSSVTGLPTGQIEYLKISDDGFSELMKLYDLPPTFASKYSVVTDHLTVKTDYNNDKDYMDEGEIMVYSRQ
jgi:hypothetical protein